MPANISFLLSGMICLVASVVSADDKQQPFPEILTLEYALSLADEAHPDLLLQDAQILSAQAEQQRIENNNGFEIYLDIGVQETDNDRSSIQRSDHTRAGLIVSKTLYDFGRSSRLLDSTTETIESEKWTFLDLRAQRRLDILQAYFDVLLADLLFSQYNEAMATAYVNATRLRDRRELGQVSDLAVLESETEYERVRGLRYKSENQQRETRARLAAALNRPESLPSNLATPNLDVLKREMPEVEELQKLALVKNFRLLSLKRKIAASEQLVMAARAGTRPILRGNVEAYEFDGRQGASDEVRAEVALEIPLYKATQDASVARELARLYSVRAKLAKSEVQLGQAILELWHKIEELRVKRDEMARLLEFRELSLDRSRALYEMEVKADLGDAMVKLTEAQYLFAQTDYRLALAWYKMDILTGQLELVPVKAVYHQNGINQE